MQTSQVSNPANVLSVQSPANKQADANAPTQPFNQVLSREMDGRRNAGEASRTREASQPAASRQPVKNNTRQAESKPASESKAKDEAEAAGEAPEVASQASEDMLALVANLSQLATQPAEAAKPETAVQETPVVTDPALLAGIVQMEKTASQPATPLAALTPTGDSAGHGKQEAVLTALAERTGDAHPGMAASDAELTTPLAALAADAQETTTATSTSDFAAAVQNSLSGVAGATVPVQNAAMQAVHATERLTPRVGTPAWDQALGQKVVWMVAGEQQSASLTLNPPDLGPLQVVLNVSNSQANATFIAAQPEVRQALEAALPKLRDMLGEAGIQLGQASVNSGEPNQQGTFEQQAAQRFGQSGRRGDSVDVPGAAASVRSGHVQPAASGVGLVDTFV